jgi:cystathionine beta-lyase
VKWRFKEPDVLPLCVAEMDVRLAEPIRHALAELVERGDTGYVTWDGLPERLDRPSSSRHHHKH